MSKSQMRSGVKSAPKSAATKKSTPAPRTPATPSTPTRPVTAPTPQRAPGAPAQNPAPERRSGDTRNTANGAATTGPVFTKLAAPENRNTPDNANADITSESNYNQGKTTGEHRSEQMAATEEAAQQLREHPQGLPLPTSGQPLTKPEPEAVGAK